MNTSSPNAASIEDALRYVLANVDDARAALDTANSALATATAFGRIVLTRNHDHDDGSKDIGER